MSSASSRVAEQSRSFARSYKQTREERDYLELDLSQLCGSYVSLRRTGLASQPIIECCGALPGSKWVRSEIYDPSDPAVQAEPLQGKVLRWEIGEDDKGCARVYIFISVPRTGISRFAAVSYGLPETYRALLTRCQLEELKAAAA